MAKLEKPVAIKPNTHGGAREGSGRKPFVPTDAERKQVEALAGVGLPQEQIGALLRDGVCVDVVRDNFAHELKAGKAKASAKIGQTLFNRAIGGETAALIWWTKSQMRWKEVQQHEITGRDGAPIQVATIDVSKISTEALAEIMAARDATDAS
jgi:hypothetical protein